MLKILTQRIDEIKTQTEIKFTEYLETSNEVLYNCALYDAVKERTKSDLRRGAAQFGAFFCLCIPLIYYFGNYGAVFLIPKMFHLVYLLIIGDEVRARIKNPYAVESSKNEHNNDKIDYK